MNTIKRLSYAACCAFLCIGLVATIGQTQETAGDYVAPSEAVPEGAAPHMQVQLLSQGEETKEYASSSARETKPFPACRLSHKGITSRARISPRLAGLAGPPWRGSIRSATCSRKSQSMVRSRFWL